MGLFSVFVAIVFCVVHAYVPADGIVINTVPYSSVFDDYNICYKGGYDADGIDTTTWYGDCEGTTFIMACKPRNFDDFTVIASIPRALFDPMQIGDFNTAVNTTYDSFFYNVPESGIGFSPTSQLQAGPFSCDASGDFPNQRLCWRIDGDGLLTTFGSSARCGNLQNIKSDIYEQYIFHDPCFNKTNGQSCSTTDQCWQGATTCQAGRCVGSSYLQCNNPNQCQEPTVCTPSTGTCDYPPKVGGTPCDDGLYCTVGETCDGEGVCTNETPRACPSPPVGQCEGALVCNETLNACVPSILPDGTPCTSGGGSGNEVPPSYDPCIRDACLAGVCSTGQVRQCPAIYFCQDDGYCDSNVGGCLFPPTNTKNGLNCSVANDLCAPLGECFNSQCVALPGQGGCTVDDDCTLTAICNPNNGACLKTYRSPGSSCDDNDGCTFDDRCSDDPIAPVCISGEELECNYPGECYEPNPCTANACPVPQPSPTSKRCSGANKCFQYFCDGSGGCAVGPAIPPPPSSFCEQVSTCNPSTGEFTKTPINDGLSCPHPSPCVPSATCDTGLCVPDFVDLNVPGCQTFGVDEFDSASILENIFN